MLRTFRFRNKRYFDSQSLFTDESSKIEINANEAEQTLDIAVYLSAADGKANGPQGAKANKPVSDFILDPKKKLGIILNEDKGSGGGELIFLGRIIKNNNKEAIYQTSISLSELKLKDNLVNFYFFDDNGGTPSGVTALGSLTGFVEDVATSEVRLARPGTQESSDQLFWKEIRNNTIKFSDYEKFINKVLCTDAFVNGQKPDRNALKARSPFIASEEYNLLKFATEFFMLRKFGVKKEELGAYLGSSQKLPYYDFVINRLKDDLEFDDNNQLPGSPTDCQTREFDRLYSPFKVELIWNYWMEQGMLVQTMNLISLRFQNIGSNGAEVGALTRFDIDPLRPLSHILWSYIQDEQHRLMIPQRANEYLHEYGLSISGRAVPRLTGIDNRSKFLEAFHNLLTQAAVYFKESDDTTRIADAFPVLNSLKEVHLLLAEGNHNAYGNLTWTARHEMLVQQYILSRHEMREFLGGRIMVPYPETWMDRVDTMRNIQGWGGTGIIHFYELAVHGEQALLSIRYGNWSDVNLDSRNAANWAQDFRNSIQRYIHAYRVVTGVDLSADAVESVPREEKYMQPSTLMQRRLVSDRSRRAS